MGTRTQVDGAEEQIHAGVPVGPSPWSPVAPRDLPDGLEPFIPELWSKALTEAFTQELISGSKISKLTSGV